MKTILIIFFAFFSFVSYSQNSFYDFVVKDINGNDFAFSQLKGKRVLIVNTASRCMLTPQYAELERLYQKYKDKDFIVIGFPANNFFNREPGSDEEIRVFCSNNYGITFPLMSKISVRGQDLHPVYDWLTSKSLNGARDSEVKWNFQKYILDEQGTLIRILKPGTSVKRLQF